MGPSGPCGLSRPCLLNRAWPQDPAPTSAALGPASTGPSRAGFLLCFPKAQHSAETPQIVSVSM